MDAEELRERVRLHGLWLAGDPSGKRACRSDRDENFAYNVGDRVTPDRFDPNPLDECSHGIHVFLTRMEAIEYLAPDVARTMTDAPLTKPEEA